MAYHYHEKSGVWSKSHNEVQKKLAEQRRKDLAARRKLFKSGDLLQKKV